MADVKGDVAGLAMPGAGEEKILKRAAQIGIDGYAPEASPVLFWDLYGKAGHPVRTTVSEMGPSLLARILESNDTQSGVLEIALSNPPTIGVFCCSTSTISARFSISLRKTETISTSYGLVSAQSVGAIQRSFLHARARREENTSLANRHSI